MLRRLLLLIFLGLPVLAYGAEPAENLDYSLAISFDIVSAKLTGVATIPVKKGQKLTLHKETLQVTQVTLGREEIKFFPEEEVIRISATRAGILKIRYLAVFTSS